MAMTSIQAYDRANHIWRKSGIHGSVDRVFDTSGILGRGFEWGVDLNGDNRLHLLDGNGHVACGHDHCLMLEKQRDTYDEAMARS